jgi:hypothetical protein
MSVGRVVLFIRFSLPGTPGQSVSTGWLPFDILLRAGGTPGQQSCHRVVQFRVGDLVGLRASQVGMPMMLSNETDQCSELVTHPAEGVIRVGQGGPDVSPTCASSPTKGGSRTRLGGWRDENLLVVPEEISENGPERLPNIFNFFLAALRGSVLNHYVPVCYTNPTRQRWPCWRIGLGDCAKQACTWRHRQ